LKEDEDRSSYDAVLEFLSATVSHEKPFVLQTRDEVSLHFDHLAIQSSMLRRTPDRLTLDYTRQMMGFALLQPAPQRLCMIGLGGGSMVKYCYRRMPDTNITAVEISPGVIALRDVFQIPPDDGRFSVVCADGAQYVQESLSSADVILLDAFIASGMATQCATRKFFEACYDRLTDNGVLVTNFIGGDPLLPLHLETFDALFGISYSLVPSGAGSNYIGFAWKGPRRLPSRQIMLARARELAWASDLPLASTARRMKDGEHFDWNRLVWRWQGGGRWSIDH